MTLPSWFEGAFVVVMLIIAVMFFATLFLGGQVSSILRPESYPPVAPSY